MEKYLEKFGFGSWLTRGMYAFANETNITAPNDVKFERLDKSNILVYASIFLKGWILDRSPTLQEYENLVEDLNWILTHRKNDAYFFLAKLGDEAVGTSGVYVKRSSVYFVGGNVLKEFRGRGIYRGLLAERIRLTKELNHQLIVTGARERTSVPVLEKFGFKTAYQKKVYQLGGVLPE
jgi:GNAT superfamily N-acetyltransferase